MRARDSLTVSGGIRSGSSNREKIRIPTNAMYVFPSEITFTLVGEDEWDLGRRGERVWRFQWTGQSES